MANALGPDEHFGGPNDELQEAAAAAAIDEQLGLSLSQMTNGHGDRVLADAFIEDHHHQHHQQAHSIGQEHGHDAQLSLALQDPSMGEGIVQPNDLLICYDNY